MWWELHQTIENLKLLLFVFSIPNKCAHKNRVDRDESFQVCRLQIPQQVWPAVAVQYITFVLK